jgi:hypothetical protein
MGENRNTYGLLFSKARGKEAARKTKTNAVDYIKVDLGERVWCGIEWLGLAHDRDQWRALVNMVMNLQVP